MIVGPRILLLLLCLSLLSAGNLSATEEYAASTGRECGVCHLNTAGGGELTAAGKGYARFLSANASAAEAQPAPMTHAVILLVGFIHTFFGFFWFGTILYVHLVLKPAYASQGLPRGEVRLGLLSIVVMGVSGAILFAARVPNFAFLFDSRFGILLMIKIGLYLLMVLSALLAVFFIGPRMRQKQKKAAGTTPPGEMTLAEMAQCDGKAGRPAYFAYRGEIYDASQSPKWKNGTHMGRHTAGVDLTEQLKQAPHGEDLVLAMQKIGTLHSDQTQTLTQPQKVFFTMAYLNLGFVVAIIAILACWKWW